MTLIKFEPLRELDTFNEKIQKFLNQFPSLANDFGNSFDPNIDISEDNDNIYVEAEIPGVNKKDINISIEDNILTIKGEKKFKEKEEKKDKSIFRSERSYGSFTRTFTLPANINTDKIDAKFEDGILNITLAKEHPKVKKEKLIEIK